MGPACWILLPLAAQLSVSASEREVLPVLVLSPSNQATHLSRSTLVRLMSDRIEANTKYRVMSIEGEDASACRGKLSCLAQLGLREAPNARHLVVVSLLPRAKGDDLTSILLLNLERARPLFDRPEGGAPDQTLEIRLAETAVEVPEVRAPLRDDQEADEFLRDLLEQNLRPAFERAGAWKPYGQLKVTAEVAGLELVLDGRSVGSTVHGETMLVQVEAGTRTLEVRGVGYAPIRQEVQVNSGETQTVTLDLRTDQDFSTERRVATIAGGFLGAVGLALIVHGITANPVVPSCVGEASACSTGTEYVRFGYVGDPADLQLGRSANGDGPAIFPLGLGVLASGLSLSLGTLIFGGDDQLPWPQVLVGLAAGALVYSALLVAE